jgi:hypothetical protein
MQEPGGDRACAGAGACSHLVLTGSGGENGGSRERGDDDQGRGRESDGDLRAEPPF